MTQIVAKNRGNDFEVPFELKRNLRFVTHACDAFDVYNYFTITSTKFF